MRRFQLCGLLSTSTLALATMSAGRLPAFAMRGHHHIGAFATLQKSSQILKNREKSRHVPVATIPHLSSHRSSIAERFFSKLSSLHSSAKSSDLISESPRVRISDTYDGGNAEFVSSEVAPVDAAYDEIVRVNIRPDPWVDCKVTLPRFLLI